MRDDRHARRPLRQTGRLQEFVLQRRDRRCASCDFDRARPNSRSSDSVGNFPYIQFGDFIHRPRAPVHRQPHVLEVEPGRADDIHFGFFGNLSHQCGVAAEFDRAGIDEAANAMFGAQLDQAPYRLLDEAGTIERRRRDRIRRLERR